MKPVVLIFGPTASGKTSLAIDLAKNFNGEIDLCDFREAYSAARWREEAVLAIRRIHARNKLPIVVGGTGLYFDALLFTPSFGQTETKPEIRKALSEKLTEIGSAALHQELSAIDPKTAERIHPNDEKRIIRALEIYIATGKLPSEAQNRGKNTEFEFLSFYLNFADRKKLYDACDKRVIQMAESGLIKEVCTLLDQGLADSPTASQAIGYKEFIEYHRGELSLEDSLALIQKRTRNYAKRQITWFSKMNAVRLFSDDPPAKDFAAVTLSHFLKGASC